MICAVYLSFLLLVRTIKHSGVLLHYIPNFITVSRTTVNVMEEYFHMLMIQPDEWRYETKTFARIFFSFLPKRGQNEIVWIIEGTSTYPCAKHVANEGVWGHAPPGNLEFGPFIRHNLVESWTILA